MRVLSNACLLVRKTHFHVSEMSEPQKAEVGEHRRHCPSGQRGEGRAGVRTSGLRCPAGGRDTWAPGRFRGGSESPGKARTSEGLYSMGKDAGEENPLLSGIRGSQKSEPIAFWALRVNKRGDQYSPRIQNSNFHSTELWAGIHNVHIVLSPEADTLP